MEDLFSSGDCLTDLAMEDPASISQHCQQMMMMLNDDNLMLLDPSEMFIHQQSYSSSPGINQNSNPNHGISIITTPKKEVKVENTMSMNKNGVWSLSSTSSSCSPPSGQLISFGSTDDFEIKQEYGDHDRTNNSTYTKIKPKTKKRSIETMPVCTQEHVLAERKRREIMTQRFLALSALIPGLKKMDKASILGDAAKYLKQLEEQVKVLEEQTTKRIVESVVIAKRTQNSNENDDDNSSFDEDGVNKSNPLLEIEARASNKNVLIRVHSQKDQGLPQKILNEIEKLHLTTLNYSTTPFGNHAMNITIIAQMDDGFNMKMKDLALHMRLKLQTFSNALENN